VPITDKKVTIGGIKVSQEMILVNLAGVENTEDMGGRLCTVLAHNQINMPFLSATQMNGRQRISCCISEADGERVKELIRLGPKPIHPVEFLPGVGLLSVFPHKFSLKTLGILLYLFGKNHIPLYGLASSISALTFVTQYTHLNKAVAAILKHLELPPAHAPFRSEIRVKQTA
jgi:aspartokinase